MNMDERIARINELYHKSQAEGLTEEEKEEQVRLRREYVASVRNNLRSQLDNLVIEKPDGSVVDLGEKFGRKTAGQESGSEGTAGKELDGKSPEGKGSGGKEPEAGGQHGQA